MDKYNIEFIEADYAERERIISNLIVNDENEKASYMISTLKNIAPTESDEPLKIIRRIDPPLNRNYYLTNDKVVHQYTTDRNLVKIYESFSDAAKVMNCNEDDLCVACTMNIPILGYRWLAVERDRPRVAMPVPSISTGGRRSGMVAQLDLDGCTIIAVHKDKVRAGKAAGFVLPTAVNTAMNGHLVCAGFRWAMYDDCTEAMRKAFGPIVLEKVVIRGRSICQIDPKSNEIVKEFPNISEACRVFEGNHGSFQKACDEGILYKNFNWKFA
jgi:hypothetical protein